MPTSGFDDLRVRAERCLANPAPTVAEAHELAAETLSLLALHQDALTGATAGTPYRDPSHRPACGDPSPAALVALERALAASERRLEEALLELARLRESSPKW